MKRSTEQRAPLFCACPPQHRTSSSMNGFRYFMIRTRVWLRYVLDLSPSEQRGILGLILLFLMVDLYYIIDFQPALPRDQSEKYTRYLVEMKEKEPAEPMVSFMPDTVSEASLIRWGWNRKLATRLINYRKKAGSFRSERQIRSLYGMTDSIFSAVQPFLIFNEPVKKVRDTLRIQAGRRCPEPMDVNMADSTMLTHLHGIGRVLSARIVAYRELLGGYVAVNQLGEIYGLKEETLEHISSRLYVDSLFTPRKIPYREGGYQELYSHPYLDSKQAVFLIRYRQQHGTRGLLSAMESNPRFKDLDIIRLKPYLPVSDSSSLYR
ncbi:MAG: helix-hairpin-helix domain-containing protein [Cyclobacteriaceae bacterium]